MSPQQQSTMEADTMLDVYILDYLVKRKLSASIKAFVDEAKVPMHVCAIDAPRGFLFEWWTVFWDTFIYRYKRHQGSAEPCKEAIRVTQPQHQSQSMNVNNAITGEIPWTDKALVPKKQPVPKQWYGNNMGLVMNPVNSLNRRPIEHQKQALVPTHDTNTFMSYVINPSLRGPQAATGSLASLPLKGWPLTGLDQVQPRLQEHRATLPPPQPSHQPQTEAQLQCRSERKRKQPLTPLRLAASSGTANAIGLLSSSAGDTASVPNSPHNDKMNIDDFLNYGALDGNNNSSLSHASTDPEMDASDSFTFLEIGSIHVTSVSCCHVSLDGKLVATGGQDKKARLWCTGSRETKATLDGHSQAITDIRFSPSMLRLATSSHDKTITVWDIENPGYSIMTFTGHAAAVLSLDFHPKKEDLICSCDESEIRYWTIKNAGCVKVAKGGANLVRFQPGVGKHLAAVAGKSVSLFDLENLEAHTHVLEAHASDVQSICWDSSGDHLVSVCEDLVKVWKMNDGEANCVRELSVTGKRFLCAAFHPCYPSLLIIGCYQSMELWNMGENKMMTRLEEPVSMLAISSGMSGLIASAGHDHVVKLWK